MWTLNANAYPCIIQHVLNTKPWYVSLWDHHLPIRPETEEPTKKKLVGIRNRVSSKAQIDALYSNAIEVCWKSLIGEGPETEEPTMQRGWNSISRSVWSGNGCNALERKRSLLKVLGRRRLRNTWINDASTRLLSFMINPRRFLLAIMFSLCALRNTLKKADTL